MSWMDKLIKPMEPVAQKEPFSSDDYFFELKWDGIRMLAFSDSKRIRLQNRNLKDRTEKFPELHTIPKLIKAEEVILDGEVIVLWDGKPNFHRVMERAMATSERTIKGLVKNLPVVYIVFDILYYNGNWVCNNPLSFRKEIIQEIVSKSEHIDISNPFTGNGKQIFQAVCDQELEGIVAKVKDSSYIIGKKDKRWLKIKRRVEQKCLIIGFYHSGPQVTALVLGALYHDRLAYVGRVSSGISYDSGRKLYELLFSIVEDKFKPIDSVKLKGDVVWVKPIIGADVEFMEWTEDLKMRAPVFKGILSNITLEECNIQ